MGWMRTMTASWVVYHTSSRWATYVGRAGWEQMGGPFLRPVGPYYPSSLKATLNV